MTPSTMALIFLSIGEPLTDPEIYRKIVGSLLYMGLQDLICLTPPNNLANICSSLANIIYRLLTMSLHTSRVPWIVEFFIQAKMNKNYRDIVMQIGGGALSPENH